MQCECLIKFTRLDLLYVAHYPMQHKPSLEAGSRSPAQEFLPAFHETARLQYEEIGYCLSRFKLNLHLTHSYCHLSHLFVHWYHKNMHGLSFLSVSVSSIKTFCSILVSYVGDIAKRGWRSVGLYFSSTFLKCDTSDSHVI
jgi:hypothetical protein